MDITKLRFLARLALAFATLSPCCALAASKPNIVYILADDLGYGDVRCLNPEGKIPTPRIDQLRAGGMSFQDAHSTSSVCTPSRYSILTGRYNWRSRMKHGVLNGYSPRLIEDGRMTVASFLRDRGYATGCIGKWHLGMNWPQNDGQPSGSSSNPKKIDHTRPIAGGPVTVGFDFFHGISASLDMPPYVYIENDRVTELPTAIRGSYRKGPGGPGFDESETLSVITRKAVEYIKGRTVGEEKDRPFFLYLPLTSPHTPIVPTAEWKGKSGIGDYGDFVMQTDAAVGAVLDALEEHGLGQNTVVILTSDNGCSRSAGFPGMLAKGHNPNHVFRGSKSDIWEGGQRIPFIVRWPGKTAAGSTSGQLVSQSDLFATCAAIIGEELPDHVAEDSVSLLPALLGEAAAPRRESLVHSALFGAFAIRQGPWKLILAADSGGWTAPAPGSAEAAELPPIQLYDLSKDIGENHNLQAAHPEVVARLTDLLKKQISDGRSTPGKAQANTGGEIQLYSTRGGKNGALKAPAKYAWKTVQSAAPPDAPRDRVLDAQEGDEMFVYKQVNGRNLRLWVRRPAGAKSGEKRPAAVFFHGGGWVGGPLFQFGPQCRHLASRGMVAVQVEYRFATRKNGLLIPDVCIQDARSAMRWVRSHAGKLGIDPDRIAAGGGSAGGHLAAFASMVDGCDDPKDDLAVSPRGSAQLLFNPVFDNGPGGYGHKALGTRWQDFSPAHHVSADDPPAIVFLGTRDRHLSVTSLKAFEKRMKQAGVRCETRIFEGRQHGFFNESPDLEATIRDCDAFLVSLGWLQAD